MASTHGAVYSTPSIASDASSPAEDPLSVGPFIWAAAKRSLAAFKKLGGTLPAPAGTVFTAISMVVEAGEVDGGGVACEVCRIYWRVSDQDSACSALGEGRGPTIDFFDPIAL